MIEQIEFGQDRTTSTELSPQDRYIIQFVFGPHITAEHARTFGEQLEESDIVFLERVGWTTESLDYINRISSGEAEPLTNESRAFDGYHNQVLQYLYGSGKRVFFADIPKGHSLMHTHSYITQLGSRIPKDIDFEKAIVNHEDDVRKEAEFYKERDNFIANEVVRILTDLNSEPSSVGQNDAIRVLVRLGTFHTPVSHKLRTLGYTVPIPIMRKHTEVFGVVDEEVRAVMFNRTFERCSLARGLIEVIITKRIQREYGKHFYLLTPDMSKISLLMRGLLDRFSYSDCARVWKERQNGYGALNSFKTILAEKGVAFPRNDKEVDALIQRGGLCLV